MTKYYLISCIGAYGEFTDVTRRSVVDYVCAYFEQNFESLIVLFYCRIKKKEFNQFIETFRCGDDI